MFACAFVCVCVCVVSVFCTSVSLEIPNSCTVCQKPTATNLTVLKQVF